MDYSRLYLRSFLVLLVLVSLAFASIMLPFYSAIFWGTILAIIFAPLNRWLLGRLGGRRNLSAVLTLLFIVLLVLVPVFFVSASLVQQTTGLLRQIDSGELGLGRYVADVVRVLPAPVHDLLAHFGVHDLDSLREKLSGTLVTAGKLMARHLVSLSQNTFGFFVNLAVMLYLLFFLIRDGRQLVDKARSIIPLGHDHQRLLVGKFATVVRATVKGNVAIAAIQGLLGGLMFWALDIQGALLWGVVMAILSLLPAVGASLVWGPVAIYFLATGALVPGLVLAAFGVLVIGLVDNLLRPVLVGKDTRLPDYVILISTLGGLAVFGLNGFVIGPLIAALFMACWDLLPSAVKGSQNSA